MRKVIILLVVSILLFSSCATIFTGTKDRLHFDSTPQGATVYIDGLEMCKTPCDLVVKRDINGKEVELKLDGYRTRIIQLDQAFNVVSVINLGNILGWAIDLATGSVMKYDRKVYDISLEKTMSNVQPNKIEIDTKAKTVAVYTQIAQK